MQLTDEDRENIIAKLAKHVETGSPAERRYWWGFYQEMINARTPAQVRKMEAAKGLTRVRAA